MHLFLVVLLAVLVSGFNESMAVAQGSADQATDEPPAAGSSPEPAGGESNAGGAEDGGDPPGQKILTDKEKLQQFCKQEKNRNIQACQNIDGN